jgi:transitional endoplasmic reticulum ATPase
MFDDPYLQFKRLTYISRILEMFEANSLRRLWYYGMSVFSHEEQLAVHQRLVEKVKSLARVIEKDDLDKILQDLSSAADELPEDPDDYTRAIAKIQHIQSIRLADELGKDVLATLKEKRENMEKSSLEMDSPFYHQLEQLSCAFALSPLQQEIITHSYIQYVDDDYRSVLDLNQVGMLSPMRAFQKYSVLFRAGIQEMRSALSKQSILWHAKIIETAHGGRIDLTDHIEEFLCGVSSRNVLEKFFETPRESSELKLKDFPVPKDNIETMLAVLRSHAPANILLHGAPGAGKTALAQCLAHEIGSETFFLRQTDDKGEEDLNHRKSGLVAAQRLLKQKQAILIVDECDPLLESAVSHFFFSKDQDKDKKSWINHYFDSSHMKIIWVSNRVSQIDESTRRRFTCIQEFRRPEARQRKKAWALQAARHKADFLSPLKMEELANRYTLGPGSIDLALKQVQAIPEVLEESAKLRLLENILSQHQRFLVGGKAPLSVTDAYTLEALKADMPLARIIQAVDSFYGKSEPHEGARLVRNLNFLLMGPPGTGKTEFVKAVARETGRELLIKRSSDLISKYVGESEKNIAAAFREAEAMRAILFLDEADSFFINRESAQRSWEVSQTNELLTQMETFEGVLACATNFDKNLDHAVMRRLAFKVTFDYLDSRGKALLFERVLAPVLASPLNEEERHELCAIPYLTPGDFKVALQQAALTGEKLSARELIQALKSESTRKPAARTRALGFTS